MPAPSKWCRHGDGRFHRDYSLPRSAARDAGTEEPAGMAHGADAAAVGSMLNECGREVAALVAEGLDNRGIAKRRRPSERRLKRDPGGLRMTVSVTPV